MRKIHRTYKFRLYPNKEQTELLAKHFGCARFVYNYFLNERIEQYNLTGKSDNFYAQSKLLAELKKQEDTSWLKEVNAQSLQFAVRCLEAAYTNFFKKRAPFHSLTIAYVICPVSEVLSKWTDISSLYIFKTKGV